MVAMRRQLLNRPEAFSITGNFARLGQSRQERCGTFMITRPAGSQEQAAGAGRVSGSRPGSCSWFAGELTFSLKRNQENFGGGIEAGTSALRPEAQGPARAGGSTDNIDGRHCGSNGSATVTPAAPRSSGSCGSRPVAIRQALRRPDGNCAPVQPPGRQPDRQPLPVPFMSSFYNFMQLTTSNHITLVLPVYSTQRHR